jgi:HD-GYP domain-containing protein (c-di-GMP phosphodiesterase class II)
MNDLIDACSIPLKDIEPDKKLPADVYIFINGKFLKFKNKSDVIPSDRWDKFIRQKVQYLFIKISDKNIFLDWVSKNKKLKKDHLINKAGVEFESIVDKNLDTRDELLHFLTSEVTPEGIESLLQKTTNFINEFKKYENKATKILSKINNYSENIADHLINVANLSVYFGVSLGIEKKDILTQLYVGALLHDYGKVVIDILSIDPIKLPKKFISEIKRHPDVGRISLLMESGIPSQSLKIIHEHHERHDGKGYPKGLKADQISRLTKIVSISNYFDNIVAKGNGSLKIRQINAINQLKKDNSTFFDPVILKQCIGYLNPVVSEA